MILKKIICILRNQKGASNILSFIIIAPILMWFLIYILLSSDFYIDANSFSVIVNKQMTKALVEGQFTTELKQELINNLVQKGFDENYLEINISPYSAGDYNNATYIERGKEIEISAIYKNVHAFYYVNLGVGQKENYYIGTKIQGMSEKW